MAGGLLFPSLGWWEPRCVVGMAMDVGLWDGGWLLVKEQEKGQGIDPEGCVHPCRKSKGGFPHP